MGLSKIYNHPISKLIACISGIITFIVSVISFIAWINGLPILTTAVKSLTHKFIIKLEVWHILLMIMVFCFFFFRNNRIKTKKANYIKVTEKGKNPVVVLAANKTFFEKHGAKIEKPSRKEIKAAFPEERRFFKLECKIKRILNKWI